MVAGANTISVEATDPAANADSDSITVTLDTAAPTLTVSTLSDGSYTNNETLSVAGTVTDNFAFNELRVNEVVVAVNADGSFSNTLTLTSGDNQVVVTAKDQAGNSVTDSRTIKLDQRAPDLVVEAPAHNSKTGTNQIEVRGRVDEPVTLTGKAQNVTWNGNLFSATVIPDYGTNTIEVTAVDRALNRSSQSPIVLFDDRKPTLTVTEPSQDIRTKSGSLLLKGMASDELTLVDVTVAVDGQILTPQLINGSFEQTIGFTAEKEYAVVVTATDEVQNSITVQRNIVYDITPPALSVAPGTTPTNVAGQLVKGTREEGATIAVACATATVGAVSYPSATTWEAEVSGFSAGSNSIGIQATDVAGNHSSAGLEIVYDVTPPTGAIAINNSTSLSNSVQVQLSLTASDSYGVSQMQFSNDGASWSEPEAFAASKAWSLIPGDGAKQVQVKYRDQAGNWCDPKTAAITLDTTPPVVSAAPAAGLYRTAQTVTLSGSERAGHHLLQHRRQRAEHSLRHVQPGHRRSRQRHTRLLRQRSRREQRAGRQRALRHRYRSAYPHRLHPERRRLHQQRDPQRSRHRDGQLRIQRTAGERRRGGGEPGRDLQ